MGDNNQYDEFEFEDIESFSESPEENAGGPEKRPKNPHKGLKILISIISVICILAGCGVMYVANFILGGLTTTTITKDKEELGILSGTTTDDSITNIALFGVDARGDDFSGRSDVMIILSIDQKHGKIKMCSLLRDIRVEMTPEYNFTGTGYDKLNHAYAFGGPEYAIKVLNQNYGLDIQDYVTVNFYKMAEIVDAFGGVDIQISDDEARYLTQNLKDLNNEDPSIGITKDEYVPAGGLIHMDGNQAVAYARIRKLDSDNMRAARQQTVMGALMEKAKNMSVTDYPSLVSKLCTLCETSLDLTKILSYIPFATSGFTIENLIIPDDNVEGAGNGFGENGEWMWTYNLDYAAAHVEDFIYENDALQDYIDNGGSTEDQDLSSFE